VRESDRCDRFPTHNFSDNGSHVRHVGLIIKLWQVTLCNNAVDLFLSSLGHFRMLDHGQDERAHCSQYLIWVRIGFPAIESAIRTVSTPPRKRVLDVRVGEICRVPIGKHHSRSSPFDVIKLFVHILAFIYLLKATSDKGCSMNSSSLDTIVRH